jgi:hypothetical protein
VFVGKVAASSNRLRKGSTPYGSAQLLAKSGLDYLDAPPLRDDAAISYDCEVKVEVQCQARAWSERGVDHVRLNRRALPEVKRPR